MSGPNPKARERFAATGAAEAPLPGTILASWSRSRLCGAGPDRREARYDGCAPDGDSRLRRAGQPVLERLSADLTDTPTALLLSDPGARVVRRWASEPAMARLMDSVRAAEGFVLSEDTVGTNGVGTPLEAGRPVVVVGTAHYNEIFDGASCAGAPVRHPVTGRLEGVVSLTCRADAANPLQLPLIAAAARDVERRLLDAASATERQLLEAFTAARHRTTRPVLCVGEDVVLATPAAARLLEGVSQGLLWERARRAVADGGERVCAFALDGDEELLARCRAVGDGGATVGVLVAIDRPRPARRTRRRPAAPRGLAGRSAAWSAAVAAVSQCAKTRTPLLVWGEPGVGKAALIAAVERPAAVLDGALEAADGPRAWLARAQGALVVGGPVLVRHADALSPRTFDAFAALSRTAAAWVAATAAGPAVAERLGARAVELPPLRTRPEDIAPTAAALLRGRRLRPEALQLLERLPWPGNVRELEGALRGTDAFEVRVEDLPAELRARAARVPTSGLQRVEAEAIARALAGCDGNKRDAARELGISRSTLYRKLRAYGLDLEHRAY
jgi:sigma-54 dependent transcriptional regulator, acetoin dehydrogenase operon transcriptional activator AcoR